jgi:hypothetical protein
MHYPQIFSKDYGAYRIEVGGNSAVRFTRPTAVSKRPTIHETNRLLRMPLKVIRMRLSPLACAASLFRSDFSYMPSFYMPRGLQSCNRCPSLYPHIEGTPRLIVILLVSGAM